MSNEYSDIIRTIVREGHNQEREKRRGDMYNKSRIIGNDATFVDKIFDENDIKRLVKEMRRSSGCKEAVLSSLKNAFIQDRSNMITFLKIEGSLHAVVGKLMNTNPVIQLLAAECCCNLSLGDAKTCHQLAKSATAYLVASLQGMNYNLMNYSLMTLGNMCATSKSAVKIIKMQGALKAFQQTINIPETRESTAFALVMYSKACFPQEGENFVDITLSVLPFLESSVNIQWLLYHLSTCEVTRSVLVEQHIAQRIVTKMNSFTTIDSTNVQSFTCLIRALSSLSAESSGSVAETVFDLWSMVMETAKRLLASQYRHLRTEIAWLFGNLVNHRSPAVQELVLKNCEDFEWLGSSCYL